MKMSWPHRFAPSGSIRAFPNPASARDGQAAASVTLSWRSRRTEFVEVRAGAPDGPLVSRTGPSGQTTTGPWVHNGMLFFLQNVSDGVPLSPEGTLDKVRVEVLPGSQAGTTWCSAADLAERFLRSRPVRWLEGLAGRRGSPPRVGRVRLGSLRRLTPISKEWGFDRGTPVDRFYIEQFLESSKADIQGVVLEIGGDLYTRRFSSNRVVKSEVLSPEPTPGATVIADLTDGSNLPSDTYDCIIATETIQFIYEVRSAVKTLHRILRPGGTLLATFPGITPTSDRVYGSTWSWSLTPISAKRLFSEFFAADSVEVRTYGNVLAAASLLYGLAAEELSNQELTTHDPEYAVKMAVRARKARS